MNYDLTSKQKTEITTLHIDYDLTIEFKILKKIIN